MIKFSVPDEATGSNIPGEIISVILTIITGNDRTRAKTKENLLSYQALVDEVPVSESEMSFAIALVRKTRPSDSSSTADVREFLEWGAGPRAAYHLIHAARSYALLYGDGVVTQKDILGVFPSVMRHRIIPSAIFNRSGKDIDELISKITAS